MISFTSKKVSEALRDGISVRETCLGTLVDERENGCGQGCAERLRLDRTDVSTPKPSERLSGKVVVAARLHRGQPLAEAGKRERVVTHGADVMLGLPEPTTLDTCACVECVDDAPPEEIKGDRWRGNHGLTRRYLAEQQPESRPGWTKLSRQRHREVELQRFWKQEHAVDGRTALKVGQVHRTLLVDERARPAIEHVNDRHMVGDAEREVQVGEAVAAALHGKRAHGGSGNDALILLREPEQAIAERIPLLNGVHDAGSSLCRVEHGSSRPESRTSGPQEGSSVVSKHP